LRGLRIIEIDLCHLDVPVKAKNFESHQLKFRRSFDDYSRFNLFHPSDKVNKLKSPAALPDGIKLIYLISAA